ncbi:MAG: lysine 2,3-aminomutase [Gammaproteobacteria bacterium]|nr:lysine 2,3-aminomutase [Gammaproteobacteria bacterium]MBU1656250.1 lysine 2,3-aminomutase [Gammaproteobacteria bacterium]MBU1959815.1 lysine 2,3-aminomutase [Gammaproteobacteria bacterium]
MTKDVDYEQIGSPIFRVFTDRDLHRIEPLRRLSDEQLFEMQVVASVLPFRVNEYVINELIDWRRVPQDPIFQMTFPHKAMLQDEMYDRMASLHRKGADRQEIKSLAGALRTKLNPHPAGQLALNVPINADGNRLQGIQHKYRETVLFFPSQGQTCHSYCSFCFRWAQFIGDKELRMASAEASVLHKYLKGHEEVTDLLVTGGDPMVMKTKYLARYLEPLLKPEFEHIQTIRIGTKALSFWPQRFVTDEDSQELMALMRRLVSGGKHVAIMAHYNHWKELETDIARIAIKRVRETGAQIRSQGPLLRNINDDPDVWAKMWNTQVQLGIVPYYMFIERDTGARNYFDVPLYQAWQICRDAKKRVSGLGRTARGPGMSSDPGKIEIQGVSRIRGEKVFVLHFIQGRDPDWVHRPFFAKFDEKATWLHQLEPAFGQDRFFFESGFQSMIESRRAITDE